MRLIIFLLLLTLPASACGGIGAVCKANVKNIATALEMYACDHAGSYPLALSRLVPTYLKVIPTCPGAGTDTYSAGFRSQKQPDRYLVYCGGLNHEAAGWPRNFPAYSSHLGLICGEDKQATVAAPRPPDSPASDVQVYLGPVSLVLLLLALGKRR